MSKHNYTQYSNKNKPNHHEKPAVKPAEPTTTKSNIKATETNVVQPQPQLVQETVETVKLPNTVTGKVVNCAKLNVRENATVDSGIVCILNAMSEIEIDVKKSTENWFYIYTAIGAEGYCMKQYVEARM